MPICVHKNQYIGTRYASMIIYYEFLSDDKPVLTPVYTKEDSDDTLDAPRNKKWLI